MIIAGIDEAGRGCIVGPMVMCGASIDEKDLVKLKGLGVKDSKLIPEKRRRVLADQLKKIVKFEVISVPPKEIDEYVLSENPRMNLNWLEAIKTIEIINKLSPEKVFVDCPSNNVKAYESFLMEGLLHKDVDIVVEHKADAKYLIAAAASIIAKVERDNAIDLIKHEIGIDFGSGYMSDPKTKSFLEARWQVHPVILRKSWEPYQKLKRAKLQKGLKDF